MYEDPTKAGPPPKQTMSLLRRVLPKGPDVPPQELEDLVQLGYMVLLKGLNSSVKRVLEAAVPREQG